MSSSPDLTLWYGDLLIGPVRDAFCSDATWYGIIETVVDRSAGGLACRVVDFIEFCVLWNERTKDDRDNPPDTTEFEQYGDLLSSGMWHITSPIGERNTVVDAPVFFPGHEVSWRLE
jgi:hypothetical protein